MELTRIAPALQNPEMTLIQPSQFQELTEQESALRHRLELRVERAFFQAGVVLQELLKQIPHDSPHYALKDDWRNSDKVKRAFETAATALLELRAHQLYRSTHRCFDDYYRYRFGTFVEDYLPVPHSDIARPSISGQ